MRPLVRPLRLAALALLPALLVAPPASSADPCRVEAGFDLFVTDPSGTTLGVQPALPLFHYSGVPVPEYDFGPGIGVRPLANVDTIVERLTFATPTKPVVPVELVMLQLASTEEPRHYVTLQSNRVEGELPGLPSTGTLQILFDPDCRGGVLQSSFTVNFDVRIGGPTGPIVLSASETITANGIPWTHVLDDARELTEEGRYAAHRVRDELVNQVPDVNFQLNGVDESADFHPGSRVA